MSTRRLQKLPILFTFLALVFVQCDQFTLYEQFEHESPESQAAELSIAPMAATLTANESLTFVATGGIPPYSFSIASGTGTIDANRGTYAAPPGASTDVVRVTDAAGETNDAEVVVTAAGSVSISPSSVSLPTDSAIDFTATGGTEPYAFSVESGGGSIDPVTGVYDAPSVADTVTVRVTDSGSPPSTDDATVTVNAPTPGTLTISPTSISLFTNSIVDFDSAGGVPPYSFSLAGGSGSVAEGTGVFTAPSTAGTSTIRVTDSDSPASTDDATVTVYEPLRIAPESVSLSVGSSFDFSATGGKTPYTFTVASGGGSIDAATGAYIASGGPDNVVVRVTDDLGNTRDAAVTVTAAQPLVISPSSTTLLVGDSVTFTITGGTSPYTFSVLAPADGYIDSDTGVYTAPGFPATDTIRVTDAFNNTSDATVTVTGAGPLSILPDAATVPVNGQRDFSASGGAPPYSFAVVSGDGSINVSTGIYSAPASTGPVTVRVSDSLLNTDDAAVTVAGAGCGLSYSEGEPNDDTGPPWSEVDDFGIVLVPGCSTTITGVTDASGDSDVFTFEKGSANFVTFIATWNTGGNEVDFQLYTIPGDKIAESEASDADSESMTWAVGDGAASHYLELEVKGAGGVSYKLVISAN